MRTILIILTLIALCSTLPGVWCHYAFVRSVVTQEADNRAASQASEILARGCNGFIQKPFGMEALSLKIKEIL